MEGLLQFIESLLTEKSKKKDDADLRDELFGVVCNICARSDWRAKVASLFPPDLLVSFASKRLSQTLVMLVVNLAFANAEVAAAFSSNGMKKLIRQEVVRSRRRTVTYQRVFNKGDVALEVLSNHEGGCSSKLPLRYLPRFPGVCLDKEGWD